MPKENHALMTFKKAKSHLSPLTLILFHILSQLSIGDSARAMKTILSENLLCPMVTVFTASLKVRMSWKRKCFTMVILNGEKEKKEDMTTNRAYAKWLALAMLSMTKPIIFHGKIWKNYQENYNMEKTAEQKALEAYPVIPSPYYGGDEDRNLKYRFGFVKGYNQAAQDFKEKAEKFWRQKLNEQMVYLCKGTINDAIEQFKQYMENKYLPSKDKDTSTVVERSTK